MMTHLMIVYFCTLRKRKPAYTDRILYRNKLVDQMADQAILRVTRYDSLPQFKYSDHKPVRAEVLVPQSLFQAKARLASCDRGGE